MFPESTHPTRRPALMNALKTCFILLWALNLYSAEPSPSLAIFDVKAKAGAQLNIVFFGGSLTWGANATDPQIFSYRARIGDKLQDSYPRSRFHFWDAAIGGTGSQLGIFRLDRDVFTRKPDLLFLEFTVNDTPINEDRLASYEAIMRRTIEAKCPVFVVILPVKQDVTRRSPNLNHLRHQELATSYHVPWVNVTPFILARLADGRTQLQDIWANPNWPNPNDATHPSDIGYKLYADAIWERFGESLKENSPEIVPAQMLHAETYLHTVRHQIATDVPLPKGWIAGQPDRVAANYDWVMSRWLDSVAVVKGDRNPASLTYHFTGSTVVLFGESTMKSGKYRVLIDGNPPNAKDGQEPGVFDANATRYGGDAFHVRAIAAGLSEESPHTLVIDPILTSTEELRIESICVAGKLPSVER